MDALSRFGISAQAVKVLQEQLAPGVQLSRFDTRPIKNAQGTSATVLFAWEAESSQRN